jgi:hypothetical protein
MADGLVEQVIDVRVDDRIVGSLVKELASVKWFPHSTLEIDHPGDRECCVGAGAHSRRSERPDSLVSNRLRSREISGRMASASTRGASGHLDTAGPQCSRGVPG